MALDQAVVAVHGRQVALAGFLVVYPDGSAADEAPGVSFTGFGVWFVQADHRNQSFHLPRKAQTNNRAELSVLIWCAWMCL